MKASMFFTLILSLATSVGINAFAQTSENVTGTVNSKDTNSLPVLRPVPASDEEGKILLMSQSEAIAYCADRGGLPSAKQAALAMNSKGVSEKPRKGFDAIAESDVESFYYNPRAYKKSEPRGFGWFWTSSRFHTKDNYEMAIGYEDTYFSFFPVNPDVKTLGAWCLGNR